MKLEGVEKQGHIPDRKTKDNHVNQGKHADMDGLRYQLLTTDPAFAVILNETEMPVNKALSGSKMMTL